MMNKLFYTLFTIGTLMIVLGIIFATLGIY